MAMLKAAPGLETFDIVAASNRDALVPPLHCFVVCDTPEPQLPTGPIYKASLAITLVSNIDETPDEDRQLWWNLILPVVGRDPRNQEFCHGDTIIKGWAVKAIGEVSSGQQTGDTARLSVGVIV